LTIQKRFQLRPDALADNLDFVVFVLLHGRHFSSLDGKGAFIFFDTASRENFGIDDDAFHTRRHPQRCVFDITCLFAEYGPKQFLLWRQLRFAFGRNFTDENIALLHLGTQPDDPAVVKISQRLFTHIGDVARDFFFAELRVPGHDFEFFNVHRRVDAVPNQPFADEDRVLEIVSPPGHEGHGDIFPQGEFPLLGGRAVCNDLAGLTNWPFSTMGR
jgi:hypothetical protein